MTTTALLETTEGEYFSPIARVTSTSPACCTTESKLKGQSRHSVFLRFNFITDQKCKQEKEKPRMIGAHKTTLVTRLGRAMD